MLLERVSKLDVGARLPSEPALCEEYGVSRITLRHAVDGLVSDGMLSREHGRGTFVSEPREALRFPERFTDVISGFYRQQSAAGNVVTTRVLRNALVPADAQIARLLALPRGASVVELVRLRSVNGQLHQYVVTHLPFARFPQTLTADFSTGSLYDFLHQHSGVTLARNELTARVDEASPEVALNLEVPVGLRLLSMASMVYDDEDRPIAHGVARYTPENGEISLSVQAGRISI